MTYYDKMLFELLTKNLVLKAAIIAIADTKQPMYRAIQKALANHHITEKSITIKRNGRKYISDVLAITVNGIRYLASKEWPDEFKWLNYIPHSISRPAIFGKMCLPKYNLDRYAKIVSAAVMAEMLGANVAPIFVDTIGSNLSEQDIADNKSDDDDNWWENDNYEVEYSEAKKCEASSGAMPLSEIVNSAYLKWKAQEQNKNETGIISPIALDSKLSNEYRFYDSVTLKRMADSIRGDAGEFDTSFKQGRYSGIIDSHFKSVLIYVGTSAGLSWLSWNYKAEAITQTLFDKNFSKAIPNYRQEHSSMLLVPNAKVFGDIYFDKQGNRKAKKNKNLKEEKNDLGNGFTHMFVVPITNTGVKHMKWLLDNDIAPLKDDLITAAINSEIYEANQGSARGVFPLQRTDGLPIAIGITLDIQEIKAVKRVMSMMPEKKFGILCLEWQVEYYRQIFPGMELMTMTL